MCINSKLSASYCYKHFKCRCERCLKWKSEAANRTNNKELAKERSRIWRLNNLERSRENSKSYQKRFPNKQKEWALKKYNLTFDEFIKLRKNQQDLCKICQNKETNPQYSVLAVDHDHKTGKVRGLLCGHCNTGLGKFKDNISILERAISYLKENGDVYE